MSLGWQVPREFPTSVVGSLPRPRWLIDAVDEAAGAPGQRTIQGTPPERGADLPYLYDAAAHRAIDMQRRAGLDVITDGEQSRSSFVSFVGDRVPGFARCRIEDLNSAAKRILAEERTQLTYVRAVAVDRLGPPEDLVRSDLRRARFFADGRPIKVTLPAPYLVMWESWHRERSRAAYPDPVDLAYDYAEVLRGVIADLAREGAYMVQLDEPMLGDLTEAGPGPDEPDRYHRVLTKLYGQAYRGFEPEVRLAVDLLNAAAKGAPAYVGCHMDRWPNEDSPYFNQGYERFLPHLLEARVGHFALEYTSAGCGDPAVLARALLPTKIDLAVGCVSVRAQVAEPPEVVAARVRPVADVLGPARTWLVPDCGFAPGMYREFPWGQIQAKLTNMCAAARLLRGSG